MIEKVLVANRGEIACRIMKTCQKMNIKTIAVYSEADRGALHVQMADEAFEIGAARVKDSYLNEEKILEVAKKGKADAIHPGYGFLAENADFAENCRKEGIVFVGPPTKMIRDMGDKIQARKTMQEAGVPVVPGSPGAVASAEEAVAFADQIGYPVMLKAAAGGGGIGMEKVYGAESLKKAYYSNKRRAANYFRTASLYIEKALEAPRHIEVQVMADHEGNVVHLGERDCSIQRRHQKVIEEAPAYGLPEDVRERLCTAARTAAQKMKYQNAGTIEFLVENQRFYFLEMNTRLQVEHPVSEMITGVDIVEEQLKVAAGKPLSFKQGDIKFKGHSIEARVYAEDPVTFFPSPGTITRFISPSDDHIRMDSGVGTNSEVPPHYDPLLAKVVVWGRDRPEAVTAFQQALKTCSVEGIRTNLPFLKRVGAHEHFQQGAVTTLFVQEHFLSANPK